MQKIILIVSFFLFGLSPVFAKKNPIIEPTTLKPSKQHRQAALITANVINRYHYVKKDLDDEFSKEILNNYIEALDSSKIFFTEKDINNFNQYETILDDAMIRGLPDPAFNIFRIFRQKVESRIDYAVSILKHPVSFSKPEEYEFRRKEVPWAKDEIELDDIWRKKVKNDMINLRLDDKTPEDVITTLTKRYQQLKSRTKKIDRNKVFEYFMNAYTTGIEPHTGFMSPRTTENFDINMRLSLEGIGAVLQEKDGYTVIKKPVPGGPAKMSGQLHSGDRIVGVGQDEKGEMVDIVGWILDDVVAKIRGPKGTTVRLQILPKKASLGGKTKIVRLVRDKIKLEEQAAKSEIMTIEQHKIGIIDLATFYRDFSGQARGEKNFRSTTRDVRKLLKELKQEKVEGIVIDLRNNGGGSLAEAIELTGLFIKKGPVVQVKNAQGSIEIDEDTDPALVYAGPMAVLINRNSASASEIFAGAIKDYKRGLIIGETTFGKGTVQTLINLDRFVPGQHEKLGSLRLTMAQFFRINGDSTQYRGVVPDISYPDTGDREDSGERSFDNAIPFKHIQPATYRILNNQPLKKLMAHHQARIKTDKGFLYLKKINATFEKIKDLKSVSLVESIRQKEWHDREQNAKKIRNDFRLSRGLALLPDNIEDDDELKEKEDELDAKAVKKIGLKEAAHILIDVIHYYPVVTALK